VKRGTRELRAATRQLRAQDVWNLVLTAFQNFYPAFPKISTAFQKLQWHSTRVHAIKNTLAG